MNAQAVKTAKNIAVVGAGLAGLAAASRLVKGGAKVTLFEKSNQAGGRGGTVERQGFYLNLGPHAVYSAGANYKYLSSLGLAPKGQAPAPKASYVVVEGELVAMSLTGILGTNKLNFFEKFELLMFFRGLAKVDTSVLHNISLSAWLKETVKSERVGAVFSAFVRLASYANDFEDITAAAAVEQVRLATQGVLYLDHGWSQMIESLRHYCLTIGDLQQGTTGGAGSGPLYVERFAADVQAVEINGAFREAGGDLKGGVEGGVYLNVGTERLHFDQVILALPPAQVNKLLPQDCKLPVLESDIKGSVIACLDVCLKRLPHADNGFAIGVDEPLYYSVHSLTADLSPRPQHVVSLGYYLKDGEHGGDAHKERLYRLLEQLEPGWRDELVFERYLPNMHASFGAASVKRGGLNGVEADHLPGLPDVYVAGDWVGRDHLIADAAVASALVAADKILQRSPVQNLAATRS